MIYVEKSKAVKGDREYWGYCIFAEGIMNKEVSERTMAHIWGETSGVAGSASTKVLKQKHAGCVLGTDKEPLC